MRAPRTRTSKKRGILRTLVSCFAVSPPPSSPCTRPNPRLSRFYCLCVFRFLFCFFTLSVDVGLLLGFCVVSHQHIRLCCVAVPPFFPSLLSGVVFFFLSPCPSPSTLHPPPLPPLSPPLVVALCLPSSPSSPSSLRSALISPFSERAQCTCASVCMCVRGCGFSDITFTYVRDRVCVCVSCGSASVCSALRVTRAFLRGELLFFL